MLGLFGKGGVKKYWRDRIYLYDDLWATWLVKNTSASARALPKDNNKIGIDFMGTYNGDNITYYYILDALPRVLPVNFKDILRQQCRSGVRLTFLNSIRGHHIDWDSTQMRSRLRILREVSEASGDKKVDSFNLHSNIGSMNKQKWIEDSLQYLAVADRERGRALVRTSMLVIISGKRGTEFDESVAAMETTAEKGGISLTRVLYDIPEVLRYFSPFSLNNESGIAQKLPIHVMTDEITARFSTYNQGTLGNRGIYWGTDVYSYFPVLKVVKAKDSDAENWLITAETGGGKSHIIKMILLQLTAIGFNGTIMDIEGFEYIPLANFMSENKKVVIVNMAEGTGKYFDPVEIPMLTNNLDLIADAKKMSQDYTLAVFKTIMSRSYDKDSNIDNVINRAVGRVYTAAGVTSNYRTWSKSKGLTLFNVYAMFSTMLQELEDDESYTGEKTPFILALEHVIETCSRYFEKGGTQEDFFKERIRIEDIVDADLVVCSFGMAGKSHNSVDPVQLGLMQLSASQISHQRSIYSKSRGRFNYKVWEEFQRWGKFPGSEATIGVAVTGGRKLGDVNIIITNDVGDILREDRFSIFPNVTSYLIGAIGDSKIRSELCQRLSIANMEPELDLIAKEKKVDDELDDIADNNESPLTFAFLCGLDRSKYGVIKGVLPPEIKRSLLFKTGVDLQGGVKK